MWINGTINIRTKPCNDLWRRLFSMMRVDVALYNPSWKSYHLWSGVIYCFCCIHQTIHALLNTSFNLWVIVCWVAFLLSKIHTYVNGIERSFRHGICIFVKKVCSPRFNNLNFSLEMNALSMCRSTFTPGRHIAVIAYNAYNTIVLIFA